MDFSRSQPVNYTVNVKVAIFTLEFEKQKLGLNFTEITRNVLLNECISDL